MYLPKKLLIIKSEGRNARVQIAEIIMDSRIIFVTQLMRPNRK